MSEIMELTTLEAAQIIISRKGIEGKCELVELYARFEPENKDRSKNYSKCILKCLVSNKLFMFEFIDSDGFKIKMEEYGKCILYEVQSRVETVYQYTSRGK